MRSKYIAIPMSLCVTAALSLGLPARALAASPEFARTQEEWARLRDNVLEYEEIEDLVHEYNTTVLNNEQQYRRDGKKTSEDMVDDLMRQADDFWEAAGEAEDDMNAILNEINARQAESNAENNVDDSTTRYIQYAQTEKNVVVIPTKTVPQGIAAMMAVDPDAPEGDNTSAMTEALSRVATSEITYAARDSDFDGFDIKQGDYLALVEHQLFGTDQDLDALLDRLANAPAQQDAEFISIFYGADVTEEEAQKTADIFSQACPGAEVTLLRGGQPVYYYMISAE